MERAVSSAGGYTNIILLQIVVEKLTKNVNEAHLREIFGHYGTIQSIDLPMNRQCKTGPLLHPPPLLAF